jgi:exosortase
MEKNLSNILSDKHVLTVILISAGIGVLYFNTLQWLIVSWLNNDYYSHGLLVPIVSGYIIWNMRSELENIGKKQSQVGLIVFISGIIMYGVSSLVNIHFISGISLIITIFGLILYLYGFELINKIKFPLLFLIFMIPLPIIDLVAPPAQAISAVGASDVANFVGLPVSRDGYILNTPAGAFEVAVECSGLNSLISLIALSTIYAFILEGGLFMKISIFFSSIPIAMAGNILRITSVLIVGNKFGTEVAVGYFHQFSSLVLFSIALIGLFAVGRSFGRLKFKKTF